MSVPLILAGLWVVAATATAMLPMRRQYAPGLTLLIIAPFLIVWLAIDQNVWIVLLATAGFLSMFRNPLIYIVRRALGLPVRRPEEPKADP